MRKTKFGFMVPNSGPLANPESIRKVALKVEELELDSAWVHDHISYGSDWLGHRASGLAEQITEETEPTFYESINTLSYLAGITHRIELGIAIIVLPLRNPLVLGRQLMTLQSLSQGRLILGVGAGDYPPEFRAVRASYRERGPITDEYLDVLRRILHGGSVNYQGKYVQIENAQMYPRVNPPPIFIGGGVIAVPEPEDDRLASGPLQRTARFGDGWLPDWGKPELVQRGFSEIKEFAKKYSRERTKFQIAFSTAFHLADTDEEAFRNTAKSIQFSELEANAVAKYGVRTPRKTLERSLIGSRKTILNRIESYTNVGVSHFSLVPLTKSVEATIEMIASFAKDITASF